MTSVAQTNTNLNGAPAQAYRKGQNQGDGQQQNTYGVYVRSLLSMKVVLKITEIGRQVKQNLERKIVQQTEGKCIPQGFIRPNSVRVVSYSSGNIQSENIEFTTVYECLVCHPVENMRVDCTARTITKAGIHAEVVTDNNVVPLTVFIARDHNYTNRDFDKIKENSKIQVKILGIRYELNDPYICAIGMLVETDAERMRNRPRPNTNLNTKVRILEEEPAEPIPAELVDDSDNDM
jgi:DNA-directed RNA polymerase subunit E'/Rpb7